MTERIAYIYGLCDPRDGLIYYVGKSNAPQRRFIQHLEDKDSNVRKVAWIDGLTAAGLKPEMRILEAVPRSEWAQAERAWIAHGINEGWPLTNLTAGGGGDREPKPHVSPWPEMIERYLMPHERSMFAALPEERQFAICRNAALVMAYHTQGVIRSRGSDPKVEFSNHRLFWAGSRAARRLVHLAAA